MGHHYLQKIWVCLITGILLCLPVFAWEAYEKGADVHLQADPTKLELLHQEYRVKKGDFEQDKKLTVLEKVRILSNSCTLERSYNLYTVNIILKLHYVFLNTLIIDSVSYVSVL